MNGTQVFVNAKLIGGIYVHFDEKVEWRDDWVLIVSFKHHDK